MADIFLSYASQDRETAKSLAEAISNEGWLVWWDRKIPLGRRFDAVIAEELAAARCVIVLWSKDSCVSQWVLDEATDGRERGALIPVLIEAVRPPLGFRSIQAADLSKWMGNSTDTAFQQLLNEISSFFSRQSSTSQTSETVSQPHRTAKESAAETRKAEEERQAAEARREADEERQAALDEPKPGAERSYQMGNVGPGARVAQGENISWFEGIAGLPVGKSLTWEFDALLKRIGEDASLDEATRALAQDKIKAVAEGIAHIHESPSILRRALLDAKSWFGTTASWVSNALADIVKSEAAQKTLETLTDATTKGVIASFVN